MKNIRLLSLGILFLLCGSSITWGQVAAWNFFGQGGTSLPTFAATSFNANLISTSGANNVTRGTTAAWSSASNSFRTLGFKNEGISTANTDYFQVTLQANTGFTVSLSTIDTKLAGTASFCAGAGASNQFAYSLDGSTFTLIGSPQAITANGPLTQIDVSGISALQNVANGTTITLRYYASGQTTTGGWGFNSPSAAAGDNGLSIGGTVATAGSPVLVVDPVSLSGFTTVVGSGLPSDTMGYNLSGANLSPSSGSITVAPSPNFQISTNNGSTWITSPSTGSYSYTSGTLAVQRVKVRMIAGLSAGTYNADAIENSGGGVLSSVFVPLSGTALVPTLTVTPSTLSGFSYTGAGPSDTLGFWLSGVALSPATGSITVTPTTDYDISVDGGTTWISSPLTGSCSYTSGTLTATRIKVHLKGGLSGGTYNGETVGLSGGSAPPQSVTCSGTVLVAGELTKEDFIYPAGSNIVTVGPGWSTHSGTGTPILVTNPGLNYINFIGSNQGNAVTVNGTADDINKTYTPVTSGSLYASAMLNVTSATTAGDYFFHFMTGSSIFYSRLFLRNDAGGNGFNFGLLRTSGGTTVTTWSGAYNYGQTYLIVLKYAFDGTSSNSDTSSLYVNPTIGGTEPSVPTIFNISGTAGDATTLNAIAIRQPSSNTPNERLDGFRVGTSWSYVTSAATLPTFAYTGKGLTSFLQIGSPSPSQSITVGGTNLVNSILVTPPADYEVSSNGTTFTPTITLAAATVNSGIQTIYTRLNASVSGTKNGTLVFTSTDFDTVKIAVTGSSASLWYSKSTGDLDVNTNWTSNSNGTGSNPTFTDPGHWYIIQNNRAAATISANLDVSSSGSKIIVGDTVGGTAVNFTVPGGFTVKGTIDVAPNGILTWSNAVNSTQPTLGSVNSASTVNFNRAGQDTLPAMSYGNLTIANGTKVFKASTYSVAGNFLMNSCALSDSFSIWNVKGNVTLSGTVNMDTTNTRKGTLVCEGTSPQTIDGGGNTVNLFRLTISNTSGVSLADGTTNLNLGTLSGGGVQFSTNGNFITVNNNKITFYNGKPGIIGLGTFTVLPNAEFEFNSIYSTTSTWANFALTAPDRVIKNLSLNLSSAVAADKTIFLASPVTVTGTLTLNSGYIFTKTDTLIILGPSAVVVGGFDTSYVSGPLARTVAASGTTSNLLFPIGKGTTNPVYRPITLGVTHSSSASTVYTAEQIEATHSALTYPGSLDSVSFRRYITLSKGTGSAVTAANIKLSYGADDLVADSLQIRVAKRDSGSTWCDVGGIGAGNTKGTITSSANFTTFGDFVIGKFTGRSFYMTGILDGLYTAGKMVPDTVKLVLHNATTPWANVDSATVVLNAAGVGAFGFKNAVNGTPYYLAVKHRNTIETWSAAAQTFTSNVLSYNFTSAAAQAFGNNLKSESGTFCFYGGDVNQDNSINLTDMIAVDNDNSHTRTGYLATDTNGDLVINLLDMVIVDNSNSKSVRLHNPALPKIIDPGIPAGKFQRKVNVNNSSAK